ncbi:MAG: ParB/RepB/Spo0J family partition protein [Symbiobacteriaceae bacterium]|nr:ParB/RepB/Spo0J family partition protein [Symbiobacteriaceae bacterium]
MARISFKTKEENPDAMDLFAKIASVSSTNSPDDYKPILIDISLLDPWPNHPFRMHSPARLQELADSIRDNGLHSPIIVRRKEERYQIIAGHNRVAAYKLLGKTEILARVVKNLDDDTAAIMVTESNLLQRDRILPSEKMRAYRMLIDALRRKGREFNEADTEEPTGAEINVLDEAARITSDNRRQIARYLRLKELNELLLERVDNEKLPLYAAVSLSYLTKEAQAQVERLLAQNPNTRITIILADKLKKLSASRKRDLSKEEIAAVLLPADSADAAEEPVEEPLPTVPAAKTARKKSGLHKDGALNHLELLRQMKKDKKISLKQRRLLEGHVADAIEKAKQEVIREFMRINLPSFDLDTYINSLTAEEVIEE